MRDHRAEALPLQKPRACVEPKQPSCPPAWNYPKASKSLGKPDRRGRNLLFIWLSQLREEDVEGRMTLLGSDCCRATVLIIKVQSLLPCLELLCGHFIVKCTENQQWKYVSTVRLHKAEDDLVWLPYIWDGQETSSNAVGLLSFLAAVHHSVTTTHHGRSGAQEVVFTQMSIIPLCQTQSGPPWLCGFTWGKSRPVESCWDVSNLHVAVSHPGLQMRQDKVTASSHKPGENRSVAAVRAWAGWAFDRERDKQLLENNSKFSSPPAQAEFATVGQS